MNVLQGVFRGKGLGELKPSVVPGARLGEQSCLVILSVSFANGWWCGKGKKKTSNDEEHVLLKGCHSLMKFDGNKLKHGKRGNMDK